MGRLSNFSTCAQSHTHWIVTAAGQGWLWHLLQVYVWSCINMWPCNWPGSWCATLIHTKWRAHIQPEKVLETAEVRGGPCQKCICVSLDLDPNHKTQTHRRNPPVNQPADAPPAKAVMYNFNMWTEKKGWRKECEPPREKVRKTGTDFHAWPEIQESTLLSSYSRQFGVFFWLMAKNVNAVLCTFICTMPEQTLVSIKTKSHFLATSGKLQQKKKMDVFFPKMNQFWTVANSSMSHFF